MPPRRDWATAELSTHRRRRQRIQRACLEKEGVPAAPGLRSAVAEAVTQAYRAGARFRAPAQPTEPDLILGLITRGVPMLRRSLATALAPAGLRSHD